jgi:hypothetical protein
MPKKQTAKQKAAAMRAEILKLTRALTKIERAEYEETRETHAADQAAKFRRVFKEMEREAASRLGTVMYISKRPGYIYRLDHVEVKQTSTYCGEVISRFTNVQVNDTFHDKKGGGVTANLFYTNETREFSVGTPEPPPFFVAKTYPREKFDSIVEQLEKVRSIVEST